MSIKKGFAEIPAKRLKLSQRILTLFFGAETYPINSKNPQYCI